MTIMEKLPGMDLSNVSTLLVISITFHKPFRCPSHKMVTGLLGDAY